MHGILHVEDASHGGHGLKCTQDMHREGFCGHSIQNLGECLYRNFLTLPFDCVTPMLNNTGIRDALQTALVAYCMLHAKKRAH
jgi:hypothetical protein